MYEVAPILLCMIFLYIIAAIFKPVKSHGSIDPKNHDTSSIATFKHVFMWPAVVPNRPIQW